MLIALLVATQLSIVARAPDTATTCAPVEVSVAARMSGNVAPRISPLSGSDVVQVLKRDVSSRIERDGAGLPWGITEATYTVAVAGTGRIVLPAFIATSGSIKAVSLVNVIEVRPAGALPPSVLVRAWLDRSTAPGATDTVYVGEQIDYVVDVHLNESARQRLRRNPTFFPPEMPGVLVYDLAPQSALTRVGRRCYETLSYRRALFPLFPGRSAIAPAALTYSLPVSTSFFSREESFELRTDSVRFSTIDVPMLGRPADFSGAVGSLSATTRVSVPTARMGDPVVFTLRLQGTGNVKLWPRPALQLPWASIADGGERVAVDTSQARVRGSKEFDWLLTPRVAGPQRTAPIEYPYFDSDSRAYATAIAPGLSLDIAMGSLATVDSEAVARLPIRRVLSDEVRLPIAGRPWYWLLLAVAPIPLAVRRTREGTRRRTERRSALRRLQQSAARSELLGAADIRRLFLGAIGERVPSTLGTIESAAFERALRRAGVTSETSSAAGALHERLDSAAFSPSGNVEGSGISEAAALVAAVDKEALREQVVPRGGRALFLLVMAGLGTTVVPVSADGLLPNTAAAVFQEAVEAYDHAAFTTAQERFARVVALAPRSVDAWANLGTSAWSRGDTAAAVRGWQRALRLNPMDQNARDLLNSVQPPLIRAPGYVPPIPVNPVAVFALLMWITGWLTLSIPPRKRHPSARAAATGLIVCSAVLTFTGLELRERLDTRTLVIMRSSRLLLDTPGSPSSAASGLAGETGIIGGREGVWIRVTLDAARAGWLPADAVLALDAPAAN